MNSWIIGWSFVAFLILFVLIGCLSFFSKQDSNQDYLIASQSMPAWLVALSAFATNNSGWMFIGVMSYCYINGLSSIWIMYAWFFGDLAISFFILRPENIKGSASNGRRRVRPR